MILYLEMKQTDFPKYTDIGVHLRVKIADRTEAPALRDELGARFFVGHTYEAKIHVHPDGGVGCTYEDIP